MNYAVWIDAIFGYSFGTIKQSEGKEIVKYYKTYDEAKIAWKFYYYKP